MYMSISGMVFFVKLPQARHRSRPVRQVLQTRSVNINKTCSPLCAKSCCRSTDSHANAGPAQTACKALCRLVLLSARLWTGEGSVANSGFRLSALWVIDGQAVVKTFEQKNYDFYVLAIRSHCFGSNVAQPMRCLVVKRLIFTTLIISEWWCVSALAFRMNISGSILYHIMKVSISFGINTGLKTPSDQY